MTSAKPWRRQTGKCKAGWRLVCTGDIYEDSLAWPAFHWVPIMREINEWERDKETQRNKWVREGRRVSERRRSKKEKRERLIKVKYWSREGGRVKILRNTQHREWQGECKSLLLQVSLVWSFEWPSSQVPSQGLEASETYRWSAHWISPEKKNGKLVVNHKVY